MRKDFRLSVIVPAPHERHTLNKAIHCFEPVDRLFSIAERTAR